MHLHSLRLGFFITMGMMRFSWRTVVKTWRDKYSIQEIKTVQNMSVLSARYKLHIIGALCVWCGWWEDDTVSCRVLLPIFFKHVRYLNHENGSDYARVTWRVRSRLRIKMQEESHLQSGTQRWISPRKQRITGQKYRSICPERQRKIEVKWIENVKT